MSLELFFNYIFKLLSKQIVLNVIPWYTLYLVLKSFQFFLLAFLQNLTQNCCD